jgi:hypothetical protein
MKETLYAWSMCSEVFNRKYALYAIAHKRNRIAAPACFVYFGQPSGGFFFSRDFRTAACHGPFSLSTSGLGPGADLGFAGFLCFFFVVVILLTFGGFAMATPEIQKFVSDGLKAIVKKQWELESLLLLNTERLFALEAVLMALDHRANDLLAQVRDKAHEENRKRHEEIQKNLSLLESIFSTPPPQSN